MGATGGKRFVPVILVALVAVVGGGYWFFRDYFEPPQAVTLPLDDCDLQQHACRRKLPGGGEVAFSITPRPIPLVSPLKLRVEVQGAPVRKVEVDFSGVSMNMGYNRPVLKPAGQGVFEGEGFLPVCIRQRMDWEAKVCLHMPGRVLAIPYRFDTVKR